MKIKRPSKFGNKKIYIGVHKFDSKLEAKIYQELCLREKSGEIKILELQPKVYLTLAKILMKVDFLILDGKERVYIEAKGMATAVFQIKKRLWRYYGDGTLRIVFKNKTEEIKTIRLND